MAHNVIGSLFFVGSLALLVMAEWIGGGWRD